MFREMLVRRRGCGSLVPGGFYAQSEPSSRGSLRAWTWTLGTMIDASGAHNVLLSPPRRGQMIINLPATLASGRLVISPTEHEHEREYPGLRNVPRAGLIDHVGSAYYTAWSFANEIMRAGVSRRVTSDMARLIAPYVPMPILFTHHDIPLPDEGMAADMEAAAWDENVPDDLVRLPSFALPTWGTRNAQPQHWGERVLRWIAQARDGRDSSLPPYAPDQWQTVPMMEQAFGLSWVCSVVYVSKGDEEVRFIDDLYAAGIEPVRVTEADH